MKFHTTVLRAGKNNTGIDVPPEVVEALGTNPEATTFFASLSNSKRRLITAIVAAKAADTRARRIKRPCQIWRLGRLKSNN